MQDLFLPQIGHTDVTIIVCADWLVVFLQHLKKIHPSESAEIDEDESQLETFKRLCHEVRPSHQGWLSNYILYLSYMGQCTHYLEDKYEWFLKAGTSGVMHTKIELKTKYWFCMNLRWRYMRLQMGAPHVWSGILKHLNISLWIGNLI